MKRLLLALAAGAALAYGVYRYFGIMPELRAKEAEQGHHLLEDTKARLDKAAEEAQKRADQAARPMPGE